MKVVVVGGTGTIGRAVVEELGSRHEVIVTSRQSGLSVDIESPESISQMFQQLGSFDAIVVAAGRVHFGEFAELTQDDLMVGIRSKLLGQLNLVLLGHPYANEGASFTLTTGVLSHDPIRFGTAATMTNGAVEGFVRGAAIELPKKIRINAVSPGVIAEAMEHYGDYFRGHEPVPAARAAKAYSKSVEGLQTGQVYRVA